eukprot:9069669-Pyramimonas_sp.AAC.1
MTARDGLQSAQKGPPRRLKRAPGGASGGPKKQKQIVSREIVYFWMSPRKTQNERSSVQDGLKKAKEGA